MIRLGIIASFPAIRAGLEALLAGEEDFLIVGAAPTATELEAMNLAEPPDLFIVDSERMEPQALDELLEELPSARIIMLGPPSNEERWFEALRGRAWGYLLRDSEGPEIAAAVRAVAGDLVVLDRTLAQQLVSGPGPAGEPTVMAAGEELSPRESEVLQLVAQGLSNKSIAARLHLSEHTVKFHVASILSKLGAESRTEAVRHGARRGLVVL